MKQEIECPYCGMRQNVLIELQPCPPMRIVNCDVEGGGCDQPFVVQATVQVQVQARAIEGFNAPAQNEEATNG